MLTDRNTGEPGRLTESLLSCRATAALPPPIAWMTSEAMSIVTKMRVYARGGRREYLRPRRMICDRAVRDESHDYCGQLCSPSLASVVVSLTRLPKIP